MGNVLTLEKLSKNFGGLQATSNVTLDFGEGEVTGIIGPNGAGKTTLFNLITGELLPSSGRIRLFDRDITKWPAYRRAYLGLGRSFQLVNLFPQLSMLSNILIALQAQKRMKFALHRPLDTYTLLFDEVKRFLEQWGLWQRRDVLVRNLSYGEQRQTDIIMALVQSPKLLLLDEPMAGLSHNEVGMVMELIRSASKNTTIIFIEHDMEVAFGLASRIIVLYEGKTIAQGTPQQVQADPLVRKIYLGEESGIA